MTGQEHRISVSPLTDPFEGTGKVLIQTGGDYPTFGLKQAGAVGTDWKAYNPLPSGTTKKVDFLGLIANPIVGDYYVMVDKFNATIEYSNGDPAEFHKKANGTWACGRG